MAEKTEKSDKKQFHVKRIYINGIPRRVVADPEITLLEVIREQQRMTGTKRGCNCGQCGVCNVILNDKVIRSCVTRWKNVPEESNLFTIEGVGTITAPHALQVAFVVNGAIQCGFCTPGFIMVAKHLLEHNPSPTREEVRQAFQKNFMTCRCTGYIQITDAVMDAADVLNGKKSLQGLLRRMEPGAQVWNTSYPRPSAIYKVTGTFDFGDDDYLKMPQGTLFAVPVVTRYRHAVVKRIDTSEAEKMPGVYKIVTAKTLTDNRGTNRIRGQVGSPTTTTDGWERRMIVPEGDKIRQWGECVAVVCADTERQARAAAEAVKVDVEPLKEMIDIHQAMAPDAIPVYDEIEGIDGIRNAFNRRPFQKGTDPKDLIDAAPYKIDDEFYSSRQPHLTLETDCGYGYYDEEGRICLQTKSICVYRHQLMIARGIGVPPSGIRVIQNNMGATFGYKVGPTNEYLLAACVLACKDRPVYMRLDMKEHITRTPKRSPFLMKIRIGADKDGRIVGGEHTWYVDHGPYSESSQDLMNKGIQFFLAPYDVENLKGIGYTVWTNHRWSAAFRAYGGPQTYWGGETAVDMLAYEVGMDPFEFRVRNIMKDRGISPSGQRFEVYPYPEMIEKARPIYEEFKAEAERKNAAGGKLRYGAGVSFGIYNSNDDGADEASNGVELTKDGVIIYNTWEDHGQGADIGTVGTAHEALKPLGLDPRGIKHISSDTAKAPNSGAAAASRSQNMVGNAIIMSCNMLLDAMRKDDGTYRTYDEMVAEGRGLHYEATYKTQVVNNDGEVVECSGNDPETGQGYPFMAHMFSINIALVSVDTETGRAHTERFALVGDVGVICNYLVVDGQQYGGIAQGIGLALTEDFLDETKYNNLITCGLPYPKDVPDDLRLVHIETPRPFGPFGASGTGEMPLAAPHAAICNGVFAACGARIKSLPATPNKIKAAMRA
ncbi:MAG: molybdopterin-dependent oxidoreductase [Synergistaceae bacterium]|jgi:aldehyde oxidoreductase|nr:molybdopterin-dependent oxidoreductase [Synergistaceae bacterium]